MDPRLQASFIPKKPLSDAGGIHRPSKAPGFFILATGLLFVLTIAAAVTVFFLNSYETTAIASKNQSISIAERKYDQGTYQNFVKTDTQINVAKALLASHVALSKFFGLLGSVTVQNVSFGNFTYAEGATTTASISMSGQARSFNAVSFQSSTFQNASFLVNPIFSDVGLDSKGNVTFSVSSGVDTTAFLYSSAVSAQTSTGASVQTSSGAPIPASTGAVTQTATSSTSQ